MAVLHQPVAPATRLPGKGPGPSTSDRELEDSLERLRSKARVFARASIADKLGWLREIARRLHEVSEPLVRAACEAKAIDFRSPLAGEEWLAGPAVTLRNIRLLIESLEQLQQRGRIGFGPGGLREVEGRVVADVFPHDGYDRALFAGFSVEVRFLPRLGVADVTAEQARFYQERAPEGGVSLVLGAGNVASIPPADVLYKLFVEGHVCVLKMNPVNEYLGPFFEQAFQPLIERGYLAIVYGGAEVGAHLCQHPSVDDVHITGSDVTHDLIVWGPPGAERDRRMALFEPLLKKPITSELGNVSPVLIVPGPYSDSELDFMARNIAGMVVNNASFNCNAAKLLVLPRGWRARDKFLAALERALAAVPPRRAYYPGARERYERLLSGRSGVRRVGAPSDDGVLPWTLVTELDASDRSLPHFRVEAFCSLTSETSVGSEDPVEFLAEATRFVNEDVWGTLNVALFVHPKQEADATFSAALTQALQDLRYGTVAINHFPAMAYALMLPPWGGHPSSTLHNVQSGIGWVHNTLMLEGVEKCVLRGPLTVFPKPAWFPDHKTVDKLGRRLLDFELAPSWTKLPALALAAARG